MERTRKNGVLERGAAADVWRNTLYHIASLYGRLVYLSALRDPNTGRYEHHGLALLFGENESDKTLRKTHTEVFNDWLNYSLEQQCADVELYLAELPGARKTTLETWARLTPYRNLVPSSVREVERSLFFAEIEAILQLLRNEAGVSFRDPDA